MQKQKAKLELKLHQGFIFLPESVGENLSLKLKQGGPFTIFVAAGKEKRTKKCSRSLRGLPELLLLTTGQKSEKYFA